MPQPTRKHGQKRQISGTPWQNLRYEWQNCERCRLCNTRRSVVLAKGDIPAEVLFIGEAPGESEDVLGKPFVGPAGKYLDQLIEISWKRGGFSDPRSMAFTNLTACIPKDEDTRRKNVEPLPDEVEACRPRLEQFIKIVKPKLIVAVGTLADKYGKKHDWEQYAKMEVIHHPAFLLRMDETRKGLEVQRTIVTLTQAFQDLRGT